MTRPQQPHAGAQAAQSDRDQLEPVRPGVFNLPPPEHGVPADPLFTVVGSMYGRLLLVRCDIPLVAEWLAEEATDAPGGVTIRKRYDVPYGAGDAFGVEAEVPVGKLRLKSHEKPNEWESVVGVSKSK